jgi:hypothetical protein
MHNHIVLLDSGLRALTEIIFKGVHQTLKELYHKKGGNVGHADSNKEYVGPGK